MRKLKDQKTVVDKIDHSMKLMSTKEFANSTEFSL